MRRSTLIPLYLLTLLSALALPFMQNRSGMIATSTAAGQSYPIMFVTQVPLRQDFTSGLATVFLAIRLKEKASDG